MSKMIRQLALPLETHRNHYLFSDYTLNEVLPRQPLWREAEAEAGETLQAITELYDRVADALPHYNESQTEEHWIRPLLDILGHVYEVQPSLPGALGTPDYAFFADEPARRAAAPAVGDAKARGFLDWLAGYTSLPVDDWALKTSLRSYYEHDWAEMARVLKRNQRKLPRVALDVEAYKKEPAAQIRAAWETSMGTLRPLLARIAATDRLIDCIVYRLYGLTEEEIEIVERKR